MSDQDVIGRRWSTRTIVVVGLVSVLVVGGLFARANRSQPSPSNIVSCDNPKPLALVTCARAIQEAQAVAAHDGVEFSGGATASLKPYPVAQGESHDAWWVTFPTMTYGPPGGGSCTPQSYYVMVDATNDLVLAHDVPSCAN